MPRDLVITAYYRDPSSPRGAEYTALLLDFLVSLRHVAGHTGEVLVLHYYDAAVDVDLELVRLVEGELGGTVHLVPNRRGEDIECARLFDAEAILRRGPSARVLVFDLDFWFQGPVAEAFSLLDEIPGCLYAPDKPGYDCLEGFSLRIPRGEFPHLYEPHRVAKLARLVNEHGATLNGGFFGGSGGAVLEKLERFRAWTEAGVMQPTRGFDQLFHNLAFDFERDSAAGLRWNCVIDADVERRPDGFWVARGGAPQRIVGLHLCSGYHRRPEYRLAASFPELAARHAPPAARAPGGHALARRLDVVEAELGRAREQLAALRSSLSAATAALERTQEAAEATDAEALALRRSLSWRVTAPLRAGLRALRGY